MKHSVNYILNPSIIAALALLGYFVYNSASRPPANVLSPDGGASGRKRPAGICATDAATCASPQDDTAQEQASVQNVPEQNRPKANAGGKKQPPASENPSAPGPLKSVRVDLSSMTPPVNLKEFGWKIVNDVKAAGGNAVFISLWSDGYADYESAIAPLNAYGQNDFIASFIGAAHDAGLKVYAWSVAGKDDFPYFSHPEWFARTISGKNYYQADEPGVNLPFASLANDQYADYHLKLIKEAGSLGFDGWVISEPLIGWGDRYDPFYTDFSPAAVDKFKNAYGIDPKMIFDENSSYYYENNPDIYNDWVDFRAGVVTDFTAKTMEAIRAVSDAPVVITLFTEPDASGRLASFTDLKEWLAEDIPALAALKPDSFELQDLFTDFDYPQKPEWVVSMVDQFRGQLKAGIPLMVSVQGYQGAKPLTSAEFATAIKTATADPRVTGVSFYAHHTLTPDFWGELKKAWK